MDVTHLLKSYAEKEDLHFAFYTADRDGDHAHIHANQEVFSAASIIKVPILLAWVYLERENQVSRHEFCNLDNEPQVEGAGFSWMLATRQLHYQDILLMMISLSDNLCTNLVIERIGLPRLTNVFQQEFQFGEIRVERKLMDYAARARGLDNFISLQDCIHLYDLIDQLRPAERTWVESMLEVNMDDALLKRNIPRDSLTFFHKTGSIEGVLHDWGYTHKRRIFLLTQNVKSEAPLFEIFGKVGELMLGDG